MKKFELNDESLSSIINGSPVGMILVDEYGKIIFANKKIEEIFGYRENELFYVALDQLLPERFRHGHSVYLKKYIDSPSARPMGKGTGLFGLTKQGEEIPLEIGLSPIKVNDMSYVLASIIDISDQIQVHKLKETNEELLDSALHDPLTGLPNQRLLYEFIENARQQSIRNNVPLALAYIDLDGFKDVNDRYGHKTGDDLLCLVSENLKHTIRKSDIVGRLGGDEFLVCVNETKHSADLDPMTEKILTTVSEIKEINNNPVVITASIGVGIFKNLKNYTIAQLIQFTDELMYEAKKTGKNKYIIRTCSEDIQLTDTERTES